VPANTGSGGLPVNVYERDVLPWVIHLAMQAKAAHPRQLGRPLGSRLLRVPRVLSCFCVPVV